MAAWVAPVVGAVASAVASNNGDKNNTTNTSSTQPYNPDWLEDSLFNSSNAVNSLWNKDPNSYVAGATGLQQQAFSGANKIGARYGFGSLFNGGGQPSTSAPANSNNGGGLLDSLGVDWGKSPSSGSQYGPGTGQVSPDAPTGNVDNVFGIGSWDERDVGNFDIAANLLGDDWADPVTTKVNEALGFDITDPLGIANMFDDGADRARWDYTDENVHRLDPKIDYQAYYDANPDIASIDQSKYRTGAIKGYDFDGDGQLGPKEIAQWHIGSGYAGDDGRHIPYLQDEGGAASVPQSATKSSAPNSDIASALANDQSIFGAGASPSGGVPALKNDIFSYGASKTTPTWAEEGQYNPPSNVAPKEAQSYTPTQEILPPIDTGYDPIQAYKDANTSIKQVGSTGPSILDPYVVEAAQVGDVADVSGVGAVNSARGLDYMDEYMQKYGVEELLNPLMAEFDENAGRTRAQQAAQAAGSGAFGGSRYAVREAITEELLSKQRAVLEQETRIKGLEWSAQNAQTDAERVQAAREAAAARQQQARLANQQKELETALQNAGFKQQANFANQTASMQTDQFNANQQETALERALRAAGMEVDIANDYQSNERDSLALLSDLGAQEREIAQQQQTADLNLIDFILSSQGKIPLNLLSGSTNTSTVNSSNSPGILDIANTALNAYGAYERANERPERTKT